MALWSVARSARLVRLASVSLVLACGVSLALPEPTFAGSGEPPIAVQKRKRKIAEEQGVTSGHDSHAIVGKATTKTGVVNDESVSAFLLPDSAAAMQAVMDQYAAIVANGGWPSVPSGKLKKGSTGKAVAALNKRLHIEGYLRAEATQGEFAETFTSATQAALERFQGNHGLSVTGEIDGPTLKQLNVPAERRLSTIRANLPRVAEYSKDLGDRYVVVNVPAMQIQTVSNGRVYSRHNAIVGRPSRPTPVVMTPLVTVRFNPYWNAPASIVEKDIVPRMLSSRPSKVMASMNMKVFQGVGGPEINPDSVNWRSARVDDYHFRQEPGGDNAMATAKIEFNSPFGIYLHDTPEPHLFKSGQRFYSSGCVRVEDVATFINWVLQGQDGIGPGRIAELAETKERLDEKISNPPQLRVAYLTAWPAGGGIAAFRSDVYELDGSGFVVGQPLPVGDKGQRFVLKPIPRSQAAVEEAEASGFGSLFRRSPNSDDDNPFNRVSRQKKSDDSLVGASASATDSKKKTASKSTSKTKTKTKTAASKRQWFGNPDKAPAIFRSNIARQQEKNTKSAKSKKKFLKQDTQKAAAKKSVPDKKKSADACKPDKNGKLPKGCKVTTASSN